MTVRFCIGVLVMGVTLLGACRRVQPEVIPLAQVPAASASTILGVPDIVSQNGRPVGLRLSGDRLLEFPSPQEKLYTDPRAFAVAVGQGLAGFLITPAKPEWAASCQQVGDASLPPQWQRCQVGETSILLSRLSFTPDTFWLALAERSAGAPEELARVESGTVMKNQ